MAPLRRRDWRGAKKLLRFHIVNDDDSMPRCGVMLSDATRRVRFSLGAFICFAFASSRRLKADFFYLLSTEPGR